MDDRGTSATKQKLFSSGKCRGLPGEGQPFDLAQRAAPSCYRILLAGIGLLFLGEVPLSFRFRNPAFAGESPGLSKEENSEALFRKTFRSCVRLTEATSE